MTALEQIISLELQREMLRVLTPHQLVIVALRWDGMSNLEIAEALGVGKGTVSMHLTMARRRILTRYPEIEPWATGRDCRRYSKSREKVKQVKRDV